jgi:hypothetical protein
MVFHGRRISRYNGGRAVAAKLLQGLVSEIGLAKGLSAHLFVSTIFNGSSSSQKTPGSTATGDACSNGGGSNDVSVRSFDRAHKFCTTFCEQIEKVLVIYQFDDESVSHLPAALVGIKDRRNPAPG